MSAGLPCRCQSGSRCMKCSNSILRRFDRIVHLDTIISAGMLHHSHLAADLSLTGRNNVVIRQSTLNTIMPAGVLHRGQSGKRFSKPGNSTLRHFNHTVQVINTAMSTCMLRCSQNGNRFTNWQQHIATFQSHNKKTKHHHVCRHATL